MNDFFGDSSYIFFHNNIFILYVAFKMNKYLLYTLYNNKKKLVLERGDKIYAKESCRVCKLFVSQLHIGMLNITNLIT